MRVVLYRKLGVGGLGLLFFDEGEFEIEYLLSRGK
jgi:hypothetical protein